MSIKISFHNFKAGILCVALALLVAASPAAGGDLRLVEAAANRDHDAVRSLLKQRVDVNAPQADGATALAWAAHWDDLEAADLLIAAGANVNTANNYGVTPLSLACTNASAAMVGKLLKAGANPNAAQQAGETVLMTCARTGNAEAVNRLLANGANANARENSRGQTALMWAVAERHAEAAQALVEHGADIHARSNGGFTPLLFAAQQGDVATGKILLAAGADANEVTGAQEREEVSKLTYGARQPAKTDPRTAQTDKPKQEQPAPAAEPQAAEGRREPGGTTPLLVASASGNPEFSIFLLDKGADPNAADVRGYTALHYAAQNRNMLELLKALLSHKANPNARLLRNPPGQGEGGISMVGATPFYLAAAALNAPAMRALASGGADPLLATRERTTPLMVAAGVGRFEERTEAQYRAALEAVKVAAELGGEINAAGENGWTPLHGAAYTGADAIIQFLVEKGARMDAKDTFGQTPLSIAQAVITAGLGENADVRPRKFRTSTANVLVKLGAPSLEASGVENVGSLAVKPAD